MAAEDNLRTIEALYAALDRGDGEAMAALYAPQATFTDPVFVGLSDGEPGDMWRMLTARAQDMSVELVGRDAEAGPGHRAHWVARYTFGQTGRPVVNDVRSVFRFDGSGRIVDQQDDFDFWRWARQGARAAAACCWAGPRCCSTGCGTGPAGLEAFPQPLSRTGGPVSPTCAPAHRCGPARRTGARLAQRRLPRRTLGLQPRHGPVLPLAAGRAPGDPVRDDAEVAADVGLVDVPGAQALGREREQRVEHQAVRRPAHRPVPVDPPQQRRRPYRGARPSRRRPSRSRGTSLRAGRGRRPPAPGRGRTPSWPPCRCRSGPLGITRLSIRRWGWPCCTS